MKTAHEFHVPLADSFFTSKTAAGTEVLDLVGAVITLAEPYFVNGKAALRIIVEKETTS